jgi:hypothetical protein
MDLTALRAYARMKTNTDSTTYTDEDTLVSANVWYDSFHAEIINSMDDWDIGGEIATTDLVTGQQEYVFPDDILKIKRIEITYDGVTWRVAKRFDVNENDIPTDPTSIANNYSISAPFVDTYDNSIFVYPIPTKDITGGIKIYYEPNATHFVNTDDEPNIARPFHVGIALGMAKDYLEKYAEVGDNMAKLNVLNANLMELRERMKQFYHNRNQDREYNVVPKDVNYE